LNLNFKAPTGASWLELFTGMVNLSEISAGLKMAPFVLDVQQINFTRISLKEIIEKIGIENGTQCSNYLSFYRLQTILRF
jgi:hypothetical protein